jgi:hypothetical protein
MTFKVTFLDPCADTTGEFVRIVQLSPSEGDPTTTLDELTHNIDYSPKTHGELDFVDRFKAELKKAEDKDFCTIYYVPTFKGVQITEQDPISYDFDKKQFTTKFTELTDVTLEDGSNKYSYGLDFFIEGQPTDEGDNPVKSSVSGAITI